MLLVIDDAMIGCNLDIGVAGFPHVPNLPKRGLRRGRETRIVDGYATNEQPAPLSLPLSLAEPALFAKKTPDSGDAKETVVRMSLPPFITAKHWCCLFDATSGAPMGRTDDPQAAWVPATDGAILHPSEVIDALVAWGCLVQIGDGRWTATACAPVAIRLPVVAKRQCQQ